MQYVYFAHMLHTVITKLTTLHHDFCNNFHMFSFDCKLGMSHSFIGVKTVW